MVNIQEYIKIHDHFINKLLYGFIKNDLFNDDLKLDKNFWLNFNNLLNELEPKRKVLIKQRESFQKQINKWHLDNKNNFFDKKIYTKFLTKIGYIVKEGKNFKIETKNIDEEISSIAGPQLVVPLLNSRYAINAANARWGSLYDALYGSDIIPNQGQTKILKQYNQFRGLEVIKFGKNHLDDLFPLSNCSFHDIESVKIIDSNLFFYNNQNEIFQLSNPNQFEGYIGEPDSPQEVILKKNGLHIRLQIDKNHFIGKNDKFNLKDIIIESALSVIMDCEDSIVSVDTQDKASTFKNWLELLNETIEVEVSKNENKFIRKLNKDIKYKLPNGKNKFLKGKSLLLIRNVGHLMTTSSVLDKNKNEVGEGILDTLLTCLCYIKTIDISSNSKFKSLYIVKPKMHGPEEVGFSVHTFSLIEQLLKLPKNTIKIGIMDEERRTTLNLKECIRAASDRVFFINTGFLDRTGDEIHTSMEAGSMVKKTEMKKELWINAYEKWNVSVGLKCGFSKIAQIGKGMWAMPDMMSQMMDEKIAHCEAGANTSWVPSPTAATLHALHYHRVDIFSLHKSIKKEIEVTLDDLLNIPLIDKPNWSKDEVQKELENNIQGILGYVVRWINNGVGCSKVPDINNIGLMEDRATLRISSQHIANWLHHKICSNEQVTEIFNRMVFVVDKQNEKDLDYIPMSKDLKNSIAFNTACELVFKGKEQPSGYTEPILHANRLKFKSANKIN